MNMLSDKTGFVNHAFFKLCVLWFNDGYVTTVLEKYLEFERKKKCNAHFAFTGLQLQQSSPSKSFSIEMTYTMNLSTKVGAAYRYWAEMHI